MLRVWAKGITCFGNIQSSFQAQVFDVAWCVLWVLFKFQLLFHKGIRKPHNTDALDFRKMFPKVKNLLKCGGGGGGGGGGRGSESLPVADPRRGPQREILDPPLFNATCADSLAQVQLGYCYLPHMQ